MKAAGEAGKPADEANLLWLAISCYREAPDNSQVIGLGEHFRKVNERVDRKGECLYLLGEAYRQEKQPVEAENAYKECILYPTPIAFRARYQLAVFALDRGNKDEAENTLNQNLQLMRLDSNADAEAREKSMFALGDLCFKKCNYANAVRRLEEAVGQFQNNPEVPRARYQLAESYRQLAVQMNRDILENKYKSPENLEHLRTEYRNWMQKAAEEFQGLTLFLEKAADPGRYLSEEERKIVPFNAADCRFNLGKYDEALEMYNELVARRDRDPQKLQALAGAVRCLSAMRRYDEMRERLACHS